jgi:hypothetical protein
MKSRSKDRVRNPESTDAERLMTGQAWIDFCETLKTAGGQILADGAPDGALNRAEGYRHLANLTQAGIRHVFNLDPRHPRFLRNPDSTSKAGAENADNIYHFAKIQSDRTYRILGRRNNVTAFLLETKEGYMQLGDMGNYATLDSEELVTGPDGRFEIVLSATKPATPAPNWVELHPDATQVLIRQYLCDWENEVPAEFEIIDVESEGTAPLPLEPQGVAHQLDDAAEWIETSMRIWSEWVRDYRERRRDGVLAPAVRYAGGADDILYGNDAYVLPEGQAIVIECGVPLARYWQFQLVDLWFGSMDYANRVSSLNHTQLHVDADQKVRVVIAHEDPGVPNWLDTGGHLEGIIQYRYIWITQDEQPQPTIQTLPLDQVRSALPAKTPVVTPDARRQQVAARQAHLRRREPTC